MKWPLSLQVRAPLPEEPLALSTPHYLHGVQEESCPCLAAYGKGETAGVVPLVPKVFRFVEQPRLGCEITCLTTASWCQGHQLLSSYGAQPDGAFCLGAEWGSGRRRSTRVAPSASDPCIIIFLASSVFLQQTRLQTPTEILPSPGFKG